MNDIPEMLTVQGTSVRSGLAECLIRRMVADGSIVSIRAGRKILINYDSVRAYLSTGVPQGAAANVTESVRRRSGEKNAPRITPISLR